MRKAESRKQKAEASDRQAATRRLQLQIGNRKSKILEWLPALALVLLTMALYWPVTSHDFVNYDDDMYVKDNPHVTSGLSAVNVSWAFRSNYAGNWHP